MIKIKNKFKLLNKSTSPIQKFFNHLYSENKSPTALSNQKNICELFITFIRESLHLSNDNIDPALSQFILILKLNEYWSLFLMPKYIPGLTIENEKNAELNEKNLRKDFQLFAEETLKKNDWLNLLKISFTKISYPLNFVICETLIVSLFNFDLLNELFQEIEIFIDFIGNYSENVLNLDKKTVLYILNNQIYEKLVKSTIFSSKASFTQIFIDSYHKFLMKFMNKKSEKLCLNSNEKKIAKAIRLKSSFKIFDKLNRFIIDGKDFFLIDEKMHATIFKKLLFICFQAQYYLTIFLFFLKKILEKSLPI